MNTDVSNIDKDLDLIISKKMNFSPAISKKWKWRILNEYPETLKQLVRAWANDEILPATEYNNVSIERILNGTGLDFIEALDLLYILYKDPASGYDIFTRSLRRDAIRRR